jgi:hypothetical protein
MKSIAPVVRLYDAGLLRSNGPKGYSEGQDY